MENIMTTVRLSEEQREYLERSGGPTEKIRDLIEFERIVIRSHSADIVTRFSAEELTAICAACRGTLYEATLYRNLPSMIADDVDNAVILDGLAENHGVDGPALVAKIREMNPAEAYVMTRMIRAFWTAPSGTPIPEAFKRMF